MASSSAPNANERNTISAKRTVAAALDPADPATPLIKRGRLTFESSRRATSPSTGKGAPRARAVRRMRTRTPRVTSSVKKAAAWACVASFRPPIRFFMLAGKSAPRLVRAATSKNLQTMSRRLRDGRISSNELDDALSEIDKEATEGRDEALTTAATAQKGASIFDALLRNISKFEEIRNSKDVSDPLPTVNHFLDVYEDTIMWKNVTESQDSMKLSTKYYFGGGGGQRHVVHKLRSPNATKTKSTTKAAELCKKCCGEMQKWFLGFVEDAVDVDNWKHSIDTSTLLSGFNKINSWLELVEHQLVEGEEWTKKTIKRLKHRIADNFSTRA